MKKNILFLLMIVTVSGAFPMRRRRLQREGVHSRQGFLKHKKRFVKEWGENGKKHVRRSGWIYYIEIPDISYNARNGYAWDTVFKVGLYYEHEKGVPFKKMHRLGAKSRYNVFVKVGGCFEGEYFLSDAAFLNKVKVKYVEIPFKWYIENVLSVAHKMRGYSFLEKDLLQRPTSINDTKIEPKRPAWGRTT